MRWTTHIYNKHCDLTNSLKLLTLLMFRYFSCFSLIIIYKLLSHCYLSGLHGTQQLLLRQPDSARTTSLRSYSSFIGSRSANESSSSTPCWFSRRCTVCCRHVSRMTVSCLPIPVAVNSDRASEDATCFVLRTHSSLGDRCFCGWTENMKQFAYQIATTGPQPWTI